MNMQTKRNKWETRWRFGGKFQIKTIAIIAEGIPENMTRKIIKAAEKKQVTIIGEQIIINLLCTQNYVHKINMTPSFISTGSPDPSSCPRKSNAQKCVFISCTVFVFFYILRPLIAVTFCAKKMRAKPIFDLHT